MTKRADQLAAEGFDLVLRGLKLPIGLTINSIGLAGGGIAAELDPISVSAAEPAEMIVEIGEASLAAFLESKGPGGLKNFVVELDSDRIRVTATVKIVFEIRATAVCTLRIEAGRRLFVDLESLEMRTGPKGIAPKGFVQSQLDQINPVLDLETLPVDATVSSASMDAGILTLRGEVRPRPIKPEVRRSASNK